MAYRQLVEKYAKQLNESNGRILDLETAIAERESRLEALNVTNAFLNTDASTEVATLTKQLREANVQLNEAKARIVELDNAVATGANDLQAHKEETGKARLDAEADLRESLQLLGEARNALTELSQDVNALKQKEGKLRPVRRRFDGSQFDNSLDAQNLQDELKKTKDAESAARLEISRRTEVEMSLRASNTKMSGSLGGLRSHIGRLENTIETLRAELAHHGIENGYKTPLNYKRKLPATRLQKRQEVEVTDQQIAKLEKNLDLEKKRRLEAEAMLGPDGKRCKKCNPIIVDLMDEDSDKEDGIIAVNKLAPWGARQLLGT
ncbi:hypothetical protein LTR37_018049 [Vermiconidia calcicola]|uniref:Uncharacterized protein n=1 Tax=Vermiconidia calcicola TaxID=1690605 RepID=A0ACC3MJU0_9PEZI|nr:hypothetical protein LTR37_018049 [Vermiconidia calcicola]